jgi:hypothetical protein
LTGEGQDPVVQVSDPGAALPSTYGLFIDGRQPVRANGASVTFAVPAPGGDVTVTLFDVSGRLLSTLARGPEAPGLHHAPVRRPLAEGVYFVQLTAPGVRLVRRLLIVK